MLIGWTADGLQDGSGRCLLASYGLKKAAPPHGVLSSCFDVSEFPNGWILVVAVIVMMMFGVFSLQIHQRTFVL